MQRRLEELEAAREWQIEQAWAEARAIAAGDRTSVSWDEIEKAAESARKRIQEREEARQAIAEP